jgi:hypothetical protein
MDFLTNKRNTDTGIRLKIKTIQYNSNTCLVSVAPLRGPRKRKPDSTNTMSTTTPTPSKQPPPPPLEETKPIEMLLILFPIALITATQTTVHQTNHLTLNHHHHLLLQRTLHRPERIQAN